MRLFFLLLLVQACGVNPEIDKVGDYIMDNQPSDMPDAYIDPSLQTYIDQYQQEAKAHNLYPNDIGILRRVEYKNLQYPLLGLCTTSYDNNNNVYRTVAVVKLDSDQEAGFRTVMFHELSHCLYGVGHQAGPDHIQSAAINTYDPMWTDDWSPKVDELFGFNKENRD